MRGARLRDAGTSRAGSADGGRYCSTFETGQTLMAYGGPTQTLASAPSSCVATTILRQIRKFAADPASFQFSADHTQLILNSCGGASQCTARNGVHRSGNYIRRYFHRSSRHADARVASMFDMMDANHDFTITRESIVDVHQGL